MAIKLNIHEAKTQFSKLIERAQAGEEIVVAKAGKPVVRIVAIEVAKPSSGPRGFGFAKGLIQLREDFDEPDPELEELFYNGPVFPE